MPVGVYRRTRPAWNKGLKGWRAGSENGMWKGDKIGYSAIHKWLQANYGKANGCEMNPCRGGKTFQWAKLKGKKYERKRENFVMMCAKCHWHYDDTQEKRLKRAKTLTGFKHSTATKKKLSRFHRGKKKSAVTIKRMREAQKLSLSRLTASERLKRTKAARAARWK